MTNFFITKIYNRRRLVEEKIKDNVVNDVNSFTITLNKKNASLLVVTLAYTLRQMYYGKVEDVRFEDFFVKEDFEEVFSQLRILLFLLNEKCKKSFPEYKEFKILK